jgi:hypothetical protein
MAPFVKPTDVDVELALTTCGSHQAAALPRRAASPSWLRPSWGTLLYPAAPSVLVQVAVTPPS